MHVTAPVPRKKEGRAARLAAMMESQGMSTEGTSLEGVLSQEQERDEKAGAEDTNGEQPTADNDTDQISTDGQMEASESATTPKAKLDAEAEKPEVHGIQMNTEHAEATESLHKGVAA